MTKLHRILEVIAVIAFLLLASGIESLANLILS